MTRAVRTGPAQVPVDFPSHVDGIREGNKPGSYGKQPGHRKDGRSTARRSTGIVARHHETVVPGSPNISPP